MFDHIILLGDEINAVIWLYDNMNIIILLDDNVLLVDWDYDWAGIILDTIPSDRMTSLMNNLAR
jgi:hypothetical protein